MPRPLLVLLLTACVLAPAGAHAGSPAGKQLHEESCLSCHGPGVYTRADRIVDSHPRLGQQVRLCRDNLGLAWFDEEVAEVVEYLNANYYKFQQ